MTDWKPGDWFKLECEGEYLDEEPDEPIRVHLDLEDHPHYRPPTLLDKSWFDAHATKIQRPFKFLDLVAVRGRPEAVVIQGPMDGDCYKVAWRDSGAETVRGVHLTLIKALDDD